MTSIYLDYAATTPIEPEIVDAMADCYRQVQGNPASQHRLGRQAKVWLEDASEAICECLGARMIQPNADRLIVTSGGTEANNLALLGWPAAPEAKRMIISSIEHPSVLEAARQLTQRGWHIDRINTRSDGQIDLNHLRSLLEQPESRKVSLVSVMLGNNETGVLQPVADVVKLCDAKGIPVHTDAVQAVGKMPINFQELGVTLMTIAAHKFNGPSGVGALLVRGKTSLRPILHGGEQQLGVRPGTESVPLVVGMLTGLQRWYAEMPSRSTHLQTCRDRLERRLAGPVSTAKAYPHPQNSVHNTVDPRSENCSNSDLNDAAVVGGIVNGTQLRLPQTLNISFPGIDRQALLMALDLAGVCCSTGSACASGSSEPSHVLQAMGLPDERIDAAIRLSVGIQTQLAEVDMAASLIATAVRQLRPGN